MTASTSTVYRCSSDCSQSPRRLQEREMTTEHVLWDCLFLLFAAVFLAEALQERSIWKGLAGCLYLVFFLLPWPQP